MEGRGGPLRHLPRLCDRARRTPTPETERGRRVSRPAVPGAKASEIASGPMETELTESIVVPSTPTIELHAATYTRDAFPSLPLTHRSFDRRKTTL